MLNYCQFDHQEQKLQWNFIQNAKFFIHENASENIVCEMAAIFPGGDELTQVTLVHCFRYRQVSNIRRTLEGNIIVDHSDVVGASPVGAAPTTSSFST